MDWSGVERRQDGAQRMKVGKPVSIFAGDKQSIMRARTVDLSTGGMRLDAQEGLSVGEKILFRIDLGEGFDPAVQGGEIVWSSAESGTGVRFTSAGEVDVSVPEREADPPGEGDPVRLAIERMDHPLKVECVGVDERGITVRTELPFLERGRSVTARYVDESGREGRIEGILATVCLEPEGDDPVPSIRIGIRSAEAGDEPFVEEPVEDLVTETASRPVEEPEAEAEPEPEDEPEEDAAEESWQEEEPTARDALVPAEADEPIEAAGSPDAMTDAFESITAQVEDEAPCEKPIEPTYVIVLRAVATWMVVNGQRAAGAAAAWAGTTLLPWLRRISPELLARVRTAGAAVAPLVARLGPPRRSTRTTARPTKMRKQKRRTTQVTIAEKVKVGIKSQARSRTMAVAFIVAAVAGFGTGVWGLVSLISSKDEDPAREHARAAKVDEASRGSFDLWGDSALPAGNVVEPGSAEIEMEQVQPQPPAPPAEAAPAGAEAPPVAPASEEGTAIVVPVPEEGSPSGFYLGVSGEVTGYDFYPLKSPAGLVVDVKGALPLQEGKQPVNRPGIKKVKAVSRESGARFIIYFEGDEVPDFQVLPAGSTLEIRLDA